MATIYLSYRTTDRGLATALQAALASRGHETRLDVTDLVPGDLWREELMEYLRASDAVVVLITKNSLQSNYVAAEIGAARAFGLTKGLILIPVIVGKLEIPPFLRDLHVLEVRDGGPRGIQKAAAEIDQAIAKRLARLRGQYPSIFISHRHKDEAVAEALVRLLEGSFEVRREDMRCTSVSPYRLRAGERTPDRLKSEISRAKAVLGIVTPDTHESSYVLFELGAAWGQGVLTFPLLAKGASMLDIPSPISDRHPLALTDEAQCHQLIDDLENVTRLPRRQASGARISELARNLAKQAAPVVPPVRKKGAVKKKQPAPSPATWTRSRSNKSRK